MCRRWWVAVVVTRGLLGAAVGMAAAVSPLSGVGERWSEEHTALHAERS